MLNFQAIKNCNFYNDCSFYSLKLRQKTQKFKLFLDTETIFSIVFKRWSNQD